MVQDRDLARSSNDSEYGKRTKTRAARPGRLDKRNARGRPGARAPGRGPPGARFRPIGGGLTLITQVVTLCKPYGGFNTVDPGPRGGGGPRGARAARPRAPDADRRREPDVGPPDPRPPAGGGATTDFDGPAHASARDAVPLRFVISVASAGAHITSVRLTHDIVGRCVVMPCRRATCDRTGRIAHSATTRLILSD
jgi:hypothetical protein